MEGLQGLDIRQPAAFGVQIRQKVTLAEFTTIKAGGVADYFAVATTVDQLIKLVRWARAVALPYLILGGGSNILISDAGVCGLVIYNRCRTVRIDAAPFQCFGPVDERRYLFAESGAAMAGVARTTIKAGLAGLEWAVSVPGTVGGAVVGNAGAHGGEVKDSLEDTLVIDEEGTVRSFALAELAYAYRDSTLKRRQPLRAGFGPVVLSANFRLTPGDPAELSERAERFLAHRRQTQPVEPSLGSTFVNPPGDYAGRLIEEAGLKGARVGGAEVSRIHANFIVNPAGVGGATATNVIALIRQIQATVEQRCGVKLEPEVQLVGEWESGNE
ncbi:MAG: UDP-N-acetylenolpyruvoylglucosamine reductase [Chloroflexi bacterium]|nr:MAG: UDP-N-acetylenolpyruvoylglucosamine reductase [Chloroflexota bacterium]